MHELGLVFEVIDRVTDVAVENKAARVAGVTLSIGEASGVVPMFIEEVFADACKDTLLEGCELIIESVPALGVCRECRRQYDLTKYEGLCPRCGKKDFDIISGNEFLIKEITIPE